MSSLHGGRRGSSGATIAATAPLTPTPPPAPPAAPPGQGFALPDGDLSDTPPTHLIDANIPADLFEDAASALIPTASSAPAAYLAELTQADQIEAACSRLPAAVVSFVQDELRGRFVAVHTLAKT